MEIIIFENQSRKNWGSETPHQTLDWRVEEQMLPAGSVIRGIRSIERQLGAQLKCPYSGAYRVKLMSLLLNRLTQEANALKTELDIAQRLYGQAGRVLEFAAIYGARASAYYLLLREIKALEDEIKLLG